MTGSSVVEQWARTRFFETIIHEHFDILVLAAGLGEKFMDYLQLLCREIVKILLSKSSQDLFGLDSKDNNKQKQMDSLNKSIFVLH